MYLCIQEKIQFSRFETDYNLFYNFWVYVVLEKSQRKLKRRSRIVVLVVFRNWLVILT
jgi:hypothetical protein